MLVLSFGGPDKREDVIPFLENVLRGRRVPRERLLEVAEHYYHFDGKSPINDQNRALVSALREELTRSGPALPVYWGNRNWQPFLIDALRQMQSDGVQCALAFVTSAYSSYSGCRQYLEDIDRARAELGDGAPVIEKLRAFYNHPLFIDVMCANTAAAWERIPEQRRAHAHTLFTAHSVPVAMAERCAYVRQLEEASDLVAERLALPQHQLVYQSRSGAPQQPWLEPDVLEVIAHLHAAGVQDVMLVPIGFISDHMEVLYDLDTEARSLCDKLGINMQRAATAGVHPQFVRMVRELICERAGMCERRALGRFGPGLDVCSPGCCVLTASSS